MAQSIKLFFVTTLYWLPFAALIICVSLLGSRVSDEIERWFYSQGVIKACLPSHTQNPTLRSDIDCTIDEEARKLGESINNEFEAATKLTKKTISEYPAQIRDHLNSSIDPNPAAFQPKRGCKVYQVGCHIANAIKKAALRSYQAARKSAIDRVYADALESSKRAGATHASVDSSVRVGLPVLIDGTNRTLRQTARSAFNVLDFTNVIFNVLLAFSIVKSFLYMYARLAYAVAPGLFISAIPTRKLAPPIGTITPSASGFDLSPNAGTYYKAHSQPAGNFPQRVSIPQPLSAVVGRLFALRYVMDKSPDPANAPGILSFKTKHGQHLIRWDLSKGETVAFRLKHLILFQSDIRIQIRVSLRLSTLLLGRLVFPVLRGPGTILLYTSGAPKVEVMGTHVPAGYEADRFIAWREETGFDVIAQSGFWDVYFSAVQVRATGPLFATVVDPMGVRRFTGAIRFARNFVLPW